MSANSSKAARRGLVKIKNEVWVRQNAAGENFCKIGHCKSPPASEEPRHRGMCLKHLAAIADGRPKCQKCRVGWCVEPYADLMCEACHPTHRELDPFESQVLARIREGDPPVTAVQHAMGEGTSRVNAAAKLKKLSKRERFHRIVTDELKNAGATPGAVAKVVADGLVATKRVYNGEGECIDEPPDHRTRNQTVDVWAKLTGAYPSRSRPEEQKPQQMNIAVAMLPAVEPRRPDAKIYTLPPSKRASNGGGEE